MSTARDIVNGSLRMLGAIASGETANSNEAADALRRLNQLLDAWSLERLMIFNTVREVFALVAGQASYTFGTGGNFNSARPIKIEKAFFQEPNTTPALELEMEILTVDEWALITTKNTSSTIPTRLYAEGTYPLETVNLWPVPSLVKNLVLYSWKPLTQFASLNTTVSLPPGYELALESNLAILLAPEYGVQPSEAVVAIAQGSKANIKRVNIEPEYLSTDDALQGSGSFNWLTGDTKR